MESSGNIYRNEVAQSLVWRLEKNPNPKKKPRKVPYYPGGTRRNGVLDTPEDLSRLGTFNDAMRAIETGNFTGLGFALGPDGTGNVWQGIDLDDIPNRPHLQHIADDLPGYTEVSPSGNGIHAIGYGKPFSTLGSNGTGIEAYSRARYFTVTGDGAGIHPPACLTDFVEKRLVPIHTRAKDTQAEPDFETFTVDAQTVADLRSALLFMRSDDYNLWIDNGIRLKCLGNIGRGLWFEHSSTSASFDMKEASAKWDTFKPSRTGYKAVFSEAQRRGWINPARDQGHEKTANDGTRRHRKAKEGFTFVQACDLSTNPEPVQFLIDGMIESGELAQLFGVSGCGKSFLAIDWCCCIATGTDWNGRQTQQGPGFYILGEGHGGIGRRLNAWEKHNGISLKDAPLFFSECPASLMDASSAENVAAAVDAMATSHGIPSLIVIDTLARNLGDGDENSNADISRFINNIDIHLRTRFGAAVLIVHHTGWAEKERARGASAMKAAMDSEYRLDLTGDVRTLVSTKLKEREPILPMAFALKQIVLDECLDADGELMTSAVLVPTDESMCSTRSDAPIKGANRKAYDALVHVIESEGNSPSAELLGAMELSTPPPLKVVTEDVWRQKAYDEGISESGQDAKQKAFNRARKALLDRKKVRAWREWFWPCEIPPTGQESEGQGC